MTSFLLISMAQLIGQPPRYELSNSSLLWNTRTIRAIATTPLKSAGLSTGNEASDPRTGSLFTEVGVK